MAQEIKQYNVQLKRTVIYTVIMLVCVVLLLCSCSKDSVQAETDLYAKETEEVRAELFYLSPCESCKENIKFEQQLTEEFRQSGNTKKLTCIAYNVFQEADREYMQKRFEEIGETISLDELPVALVDGKIYKGDYGEIGKQMGQQISGHTIENKKLFENIKNTDTVLVLFTTFACDSCDKVSKYFDDFPDELMIDYEGDVIQSKVNIIRLNILENDNLELLEQLINTYEVPSKQQQVPILFYESGYLSGENAIMDRVMDEASLGKGLFFQTDKVQVTEESRKSQGEETQETDKPTGYAMRIFTTGLLNGLNPCAASMLLMVLSILVMSGKNYLPGGLSYMCGKIVAYTGLGIGTFWILSYLKENMILNIERGITILFACIALLLSVLNLIDYMNVKQGRYGKVMVQLPKNLRNFNHTLINKLKTVPSAFVIPVLLLLGVVISAGEFFCTGQLFVASVFLLSKENGLTDVVSVLGYLLLYILAMCIPQLVLIIIIWKTRSVFGASKLALQGMEWTKLIYAVVFLVIFFLLIFT